MNTRIRAAGLKWVRSERAATATEYAVLLALIAVVVIGGIALIGPRVSEVFSNTAETMPVVD